MIYFQKSEISLPSGSVAECSLDNDEHRSHQRILREEQATIAQIEGMLQVYVLLHLMSNYCFFYSFET